MNKNLKDREWGVFFLDDLFDIYSTSSSIDRNKLNAKSGRFPYITRTDKNNGYDDFVQIQAEKYRIDKANVITVGLDTQTVFYQPYPFYTGQNIQILSSEKLNKYIALYLVPLISIQMTKFNWGGNGATLSRLKRSKILLPITPQAKPDYPFMEAFMRQKEKEKKEAYRDFIKKRLSSINNETIVSLSEKEWGEFFIEDIATIISGKDIYENERVEGGTPYISATALNNGIGYMVGNNNDTFESSCLSVNRNGSVGYSFYHPYKALFSNDCRKLRLNKPSKYIGLFITNQITTQRGKYGYGYKMGTARLARQKIMLPINYKGKPDYQYMEQYMRILEYKKLKAYLERDTL